MQKKVASVYFAPASIRRDLYGGVYDIPAVSRGAAPAVITIDDKIQRSQEPSLDGKSKENKRYLIDARDISRDIVEHWTRMGVGMTPECRPGIWVVREELPVLNENGTPELDADKTAQWRPATEAEKAAMWAEDLAINTAANANWAEYLIQQADAYAENPKERVLIGGINKQAARWAGKDRSWLQDLKDSDIKRCPFCTKSVPIEAIKCMHCQEVVDRERYEAMRSSTPVRPQIPQRQPARA